MRNPPGNRVRIVVVAATGAALVVTAPPAMAQDDVEQPPGYVAPATPDIDPNAPGLKLGDGATLAEPRVFDIKFITEDVPVEGGGDAEPSEGANGDASSGGGGSPPPEESPAETPAPDPTADPGGGADTDADAGQREERTGSQHKFTLQTDVIFGKNSSEISEESREALADVAAAIEEHRPAEVNVFGFTDNLGSYENGVTLSTERAQNTHQVLVSLIGDPSDIQFNVRGYSEDYPLYDNNTEEGRQKNRRVEISWPSGGE